MTRSDDDDDYDRCLDAECEADACQSCLPPKYCSACMTKLAAGFAALRARAEVAEEELQEAQGALEFLERSGAVKLTHAGGTVGLVGWARSLGWSPKEKQGAHG